MIHKTKYKYDYLLVDVGTILVTSCQNNFKIGQCLNNIISDKVPKEHVKPNKRIHRTVYRL